MRHHGFDGQITIFDGEDGLPLQRPPLSKAYLKTEAGASEEAFFLRKPDWFEVKIDFQPELRCVPLTVICQIELADGRIEAYGQLVIARGQPAPAAHARRCEGCSNYARVMHGLFGRIWHTQKAVVIAADISGWKYGLFVPIEVDIKWRCAAGTCRLKALSEYCADLHQRRDVRLHCRKGVEEIMRSCTKNYVQSGYQMAQSWKQIWCWQVSVVPESQLATQAGLKVENGIIVNKEYQTADAGIWAIAMWHAPRYQPNAYRIIHHAQYSGTVAAAAMTAMPAPTREALRFWSDQYEVKFQMAGIVPVAQEAELISITRAGRRENSLSVWSWLMVNCRDRGRNDGQAHDRQKMSRGRLLSRPAGNCQSRICTETLLSKKSMCSASHFFLNLPFLMTVPHRVKDMSPAEKIALMRAMFDAAAAPPILQFHWRSGEKHCNPCPRAGVCYRIGKASVVMAHAFEAAAPTAKGQNGRNGHCPGWSW